MKKLVLFIALALFFSPVSYAEETDSDTPPAFEQGERPPLPPELLEKYDSDGDGELSEDEESAMKAAFEAEMLTKYDADGDGELSESELATMKSQAPKKGQKGKKQVSEEDLAAYDEDGDGELSRDEHKAMMDAKMLEKFDADGDGELSDSERETMKSSRPKGGKGGPRGGQRPSRNTTSSSED